MILVNLLMKANSKKILTVGLGGVIAAIILVPVLILAQPRGGKPEDAGEGGKGFCARISGISSKIDQRMANRDAKLEQKREQISNRIEIRRQERNAKLEQKRAKWDVNRVEHFAKLEEKAQTDEQKQAVITFTKAVSEAIAVRRAAIDTAIQEFREGVTEAKASRKASTDELVSDFRDAIKAAVEKAEADCESGIDPKTVRENLRNDLKEARENFVSAKQGIEKLGTQMALLITTKKEAIKKAIEDFKEALEQAKDDLKAAFPEESEEESNE